MGSFRGMLWARKSVWVESMLPAFPMVPEGPVQSRARIRSTFPCHTYQKNENKGNPESVPVRYPPRPGSSQQRALRGTDCASRMLPPCPPSTISAPFTQGVAGNQDLILCMLHNPRASGGTSRG
ncbi:hypothetical protein NDU88_005320 [Pleurodeles waltl]|uniref:Uncharacterized protein n=1 Tax=Pleurodeles waltl TaxID=8319 RepID=A0AAV7UKN5_PLEWA|nr:hypothetical protein NDU88_005320 [Pleurodeles waltl]